MNILIYLPLLVAFIPWTPLPSDADMIPGAVYDLQAIVTGDDITLSGLLPTPCHELRIAENDTGLEVYSLLSPDYQCMQTLTPFYVQLHYHHAPPVMVNGVIP
jgi:hypothetical protein